MTQTSISRGTIRTNRLVKVKSSCVVYLKRAVWEDQETVDTVKGWSEGPGVDAPAVWHPVHME